jgi:DNA-binding IclR family transcriptional regulator
MPDYEIAVVRRAAQVLDALARSESLSLAELSAATGIGKASAFRLLATLASDELVVQHTESKRYSLGPRLIALGQRALDSTTVSDAVSEPMEQLASRHQVLITFNVPTRDSVLEVRREPRHGRGEFIPIGAPIPMHACASGYVFLANSAEAEVRAATERGLERFASGTPTTAHDLEERLAQVRAAGFAIAVDSLEEGVTAVAAPIFDHRNRVVGTIGATAPSGALPAEGWQGVARDLLDAAATVTRGIGGHEPA